MNFIYTPLAVRAAAFEIAEVFENIPDAPLQFRTALYVCSRYRRAAAGMLLLGGNPALFFQNLFHSSRCFASSLEALPDDSKSTSKFEPFFDAIAAGDEEGALQIARLSRSTWNETAEYEDDFLYMLSLMHYFCLRSPAEQVQQFLERYEQVLDGAADVRFDLAKALIYRDQDAFNDAVDRFILGRRKHIEKQRSTDMLDLDEAATIVHISTELLALLALADKSGLSTKPDYEFAPSLARLSRSNQRFPDPTAWRRLSSPSDVFSLFDEE